MDDAVTHDLKTLVRFVEIYCHSEHENAEQAVLDLKIMDMEALAGHPVELCEACRKLLTHAVVKRSHCAMNPKPACKHCPVHCYAPEYRAKIREVMRYSGRKILLRGRLDYLFHMLF